MVKPIKWQIHLLSMLYLWRATIIWIGVDRFCKCHKQRRVQTCIATNNKNNNDKQFCIYMRNWLGELSLTITEDNHVTVWSGFWLNGIRTWRLATLRGRQAARTRFVDKQTAAIGKGSIDRSTDELQSPSIVAGMAGYLYSI